MRLGEILKECSDRGYPISAQGLYAMGRRYGFITTENGTRDNPNRQVLDREKFEEWLKGATATIPEGYITLAQASKEYNVGLTILYNLIRLEDFGAVKIGSGKGVYYVDNERLKEYFATHKTRSYVRRKEVGDK